MHISSLHFLRFNLNINNFRLCFHNYNGRTTGRVSPSAIAFIDDVRPRDKSLTGCCFGRYVVSFMLIFHRTMLNDVFILSWKKLLSRYISLVN